MTAIHKRKKVNFKAVADLNKLIIEAVPHLPKDLTLIVAVPRSGYLVAGLIALNLNLPICSFGEYISQKLPVGGRRTKDFDHTNLKQQRVLVVDDSVSSGWEMRRVRELFESSGIKSETIFLAAYVSSHARDLVDIALEITDPPQIFEWNLYHHPHLINSCVDIDGVICRDATKEEDDDGENYLKFLNEVEPRIIPTVTIGWLVTSRLEKYREVTTNWLREHGVKYNHLIMQDLPDLEARRQFRSDARFKADVYAKLDAFLFVESSAWQSREIAMNTGKAVFSVEDRNFIQADTLKGIAGSVINSSQRTKKKIFSKLRSMLKR